MKQGGPNCLNPFMAILLRFIGILPLGKIGQEEVYEGMPLDAMNHITDKQQLFI